jgi:AcrR family transcriptional regulator
MMPRNKEQTEQIRAESRKRILSTARHLFAEKGYNGCNVSDIAHAAGMSQGNIYWYFPAKKDIFAAVLVDGFEELGIVMAEAASIPAPALEKLHLFLDRFFLLMKDQEGEEFFSILMSLANQGRGLPIDQFGLSTYQIGAGYHQSLNAIFVQGQAEGVFLPGMDPDLMSTFLFAFINGLMVMYPDEWKTIPDDVIRQAIQRLLGITSA